DARREERAFARALQAAGADARVVDLPKAADGSKVGLDDYLIADGADALRKLMEAAAPPPKIDPIDLTKINPAIGEESDAAHRLARKCIEGVDEVECQRLICHNEDWLFWEHGAYRRRPSAEMKSWVCGQVKRQFDDYFRLDYASYEVRRQEGTLGKDEKPPVTMKVPEQLVRNVTGALASMVTVPGSIEPPAWLDFRREPDPADLLVCRNGIVDIRAWAKGRPCLMPPTPDLFTRVALPFDFNLNAPQATLWLKFLNDLWPDDHEAVTLLQEWLGHLLTGDTSMEKIMLL